jgi:hypothetical protein
MDIFSQKKLLIRIIILLIVLNVFSISVFIWKEIIHKPPCFNELNNNRDVSAVLKEKLNLTGSQVDQIKNIRLEFFDKEKSLEITIREERDSMNAAMFSQNTNEDLVKTLAKEVADHEYQMELMRFEQSKKFKAACTEEQMNKFEGLVKEIRDYFKPVNKPDNK